MEPLADLPARLDALLLQHPTLSAYGHAWKPVPGTTLEEVRARLRAQINQIEICLVFLGDAPQCKPGKGTDSYFLKHSVERILESLGVGRHVSNGSLIAAAMLLGLKWVPSEGPNIRIGVPRAWATEIEKLAEKRAGKGMERARPWLPLRKHVACAGGR
jgi:hypothetical protein